MLNLFVSFVISVAVGVIVGFFTLNEAFWAANTKAMLGFEPKLAAQFLAVAVLAALGVAIADVTRKAVASLQAETALTGKIGSFLIAVTSPLSGLFYLVGPVIEGAQRDYYLMVGNGLIALCVVAMVAVIHDDKVEPDRVWRFAGFRALTMSSLIAAPYLVIGYMVSPLATLKFIAIGWIAVIVATFIIIGVYKWVQVVALRPAAPSQP